MVTRFLAYVMIGLLALAASCGDDEPKPPDDGTEWHFYMFGLDRLDAESVAIDQNGKIWLGTAYNGVYVLDAAANTWVHYDRPGSGIQDIHVAANNVIWAGSENSGLWKFENHQWSHIIGLPDDHIWAVTTDHNGVLWVGTEYAGLLRYDGQTWTMYDQYNSPLPSDWVYSLAVDRENNLWAGCVFDGGGLVKFDGTNWRVWTTENSDIPSNDVAVIAIDDNDRKWVGTPEGLAVFDDQNWTIYNMTNSDLPDRVINAISFDNEGNAWIGPMEAKFAKFDGATWTIYNPTDHGANRWTGSIHWLVFDPRTKTVWTAHYYGGLISMKEYKN